LIHYYKAISRILIDGIWLIAKIVENIGKGEFSIRVQQKEEIIETTAIKKGETKKVILLIGYELYFDTEVETKARVAFEKMTE